MKKICNLSAETLVRNVVVSDRLCGSTPWVFDCQSMVEMECDGGDHDDDEERGRGRERERHATSFNG